jgi:hypothetical protein
MVGQQINPQVGTPYGAPLVHTEKLGNITSKCNWQIQALNKAGHNIGAITHQTGHETLSPASRTLMSTLFQNFIFSKKPLMNLCYTQYPFVWKSVVLNRPQICRGIWRLPMIEIMQMEINILNVAC